MTAPTADFDPARERISAVVWSRLTLVLLDGILLLPRVLYGALRARARREHLRALLRRAAHPESDEAPDRAPHAQAHPDPS